MRLNVAKQMKELLTKDEAFWRDLLTSYLINVSKLIFDFKRIVHFAFI